MISDKPLRSVLYVPAGNTRAPEVVAEAERIVAAFAVPENAGKALISIEGRMVERLLPVQAERLLQAQAVPGCRTGERNESLSLPYRC